MVSGGASFSSPAPSWSASFSRSRRRFIVAEFHGMHSPVHAGSQGSLPSHFLRPRVRGTVCVFCCQSQNPRRARPVTVWRRSSVGLAPLLLRLPPDTEREIGRLFCVGGERGPGPLTAATNAIDQHVRETQNASTVAVRGEGWRTHPW